MTFAHGFRVGPYEVLGLLGEGGMGTVYRAHDSRLRRDVALKVLRADVIADAHREALFVQEARAVSALKHPNIVTVYDIGTADDVAYMVMELVEGRSLDRVIPRGGMPLSDILKIGTQIAEAFANAHAAHVIHRDLKPANVMVQDDGRVKVLDFGLAKLLRRPERCRSGYGDADGGRHAHGLGSPTCRPSRRKASRSTRAPTSSRSARSSMKCARARVRFRGIRRWRCSRRYYGTRLHP